MATNNKLLYTQSFTGTTIDVTHNLDRYNLDARVIVGGTSRPDLIDSVEFASVEPRNGFIMRLTSSNTGVLQLLDTTKYPLNLLSPTDYLKLLALPDPSSIIDSYVTSATLNSTTLELGRNQGLSAVTADLSSLAGGGTDTFVSGGTFNTGTTSVDFVGNSSETTFSVDMGVIQHDRQSVSQTMGAVGQTSYTPIPSLNLTTGNLGGLGDYIINFDCYFETSKKDREVSFIVSGSTFGQLSDSERVQRISKDEQDDPYTLATSAYLENLSSGTVITVAFKNSGDGNITINGSTLTIDGIRATNNIS